MSEPTAKDAIRELQSHVEKCDLRYERIDEKLDAITETLKAGGKIALGVLVGICGWLAVQLYDGLKGGIVPRAEAATVSAKHRP